jgi:hypothetical protein
VLEAIARLAPRTMEELSGVEGMRNWQREVTGKELLAAMGG